MLRFLARLQGSEEVRKGELDCTMALGRRDGSGCEVLPNRTGKADSSSPAARAQHPMRR